MSDDELYDDDELDPEEDWQEDVRGLAATEELHDELVPYEEPVGVQIAKVSAELSALVAEAEGALHEPEERGEPGTDLVLGGGDAAAMAAKRSMAAARIRAEEMRTEVEAKRKELKALMERQLDEARAIIGPLQERARMMQEGIYTIGLYLGDAERIVRIRDGEPAPAETPVCVRQRVLYMDEEHAVAAEDGGITAQTIGEFDKWLLEDPAHLDQVLPETKGVVALRPRRKLLRDEDRSREAHKADTRTYLLIRNGERLFRTYVDGEFDLRSRIVPTDGDFRLPERDRWDHVITPGSRAEDEALKELEATKRYYTRVALVLEGLVHRTTVFQPLHPAGISFVEPEPQRDGRVRFIRDMEGLLTDGRESFKDWRKRLMGEVRLGMRIVGAFSGYGGGFYSAKNDSRGGHSRLSPSQAGYPENYVPYVLSEAAGESAWRFLYWEREERFIGGGGWGYGGETKLPERRASCLIHASDDFVLPIDLIEPEELERFMRDRDARADYLDLFPLMRAVQKIKAREREVEAPFRELLVSEMAKANGVDLDAARADVDELIDWWRFKTRYHRPLLVESAVPEWVEPDTSDAQFSRRRRAASEAAVRRMREQHEREMKDAQEHAARALRMIVAEHGRVLQDRRRPINAKLVAALREGYPDALAIVRPREGGYLVIVPEDAPYVGEVPFNAKGERPADDPKYATRFWQLVGARRRRWTFAWTSPEWETWDHDARADEHITAPEFQQLRERVAGLAKQLNGPLLAVRYKPARRTLSAYVMTRGWHMREGCEDALDPRLVENPDVKVVSANWSRKPSGELVIRSEREGTFSRDPFSKDKRYPWEREDCLERNAEAVADLEAQKAQADREREIRRAVETRIHRATSAMEREWMERAEKARYDEFLAEYGDPGLWAGHRKMLDDLKLPEGAWMIGWLVTRAVERQLSPEGKTLADLREELKAAGVDMSDRHGHGEYRLPAELANLRVPADGALATV